MTDQGNRGNAAEESGRAAFGRTLRYLRTKAGKSFGDVAEDTGYDRSHLCHLESGLVLCKRHTVEDLESYYGTGDLLITLWKLARRDVYKDRYKEFMRREAAATVMQIFSPGVPGLLQTEDFARVVMSPRWPDLDGSEAAEEQVVGRMARQELLTRASPPEVRFIIDESALRRPVPDARIWSDQLDRLIEVTSYPSVVIQVLPFSVGVHPQMGGSLWLLWPAKGSPVAYTEGVACGELHDETEVVARYRRFYDRLRDRALSPEDSVAFITRMLEERQSWTA